MEGTEGGPQDARRRKLMMLVAEIGLTRDERIDLSQMILRRDITSWKDLDDTQVTRMLEALEGYLLVSALFLQRV